MSKKKRGGHRGSKGLRWRADVSRVFGLAKIARENRTPLNHFLTLRTPDDAADDLKAKRIICRRIAHLGQALKRRDPGHPLIYLAVYEKTGGGRLHAHVLVHVRRPAIPVLERWADGIDRDARPAGRRHLAYVTKQRHPLPPEVEQSVRRTHRRQKGAFIPGPRVSVSRELAALEGTLRLT
jgi:hypothetical protein